MFRVEVTVNYQGGKSKHSTCHPTNLYNLKKLVETYVTTQPDATSYEFIVVCETHETGEAA
jgi:hypothetical protein